jgi:hypothetical protein
MDNAKGSKMNERILKLAREAGLLVHNPTGVPTKLEKFAQLIVQECVTQCEFVAGQAEITNTGEMARKTKATANNCARMIEQHLGVEE